MNHCILANWVGLSTGLMVLVAYVFIIALVIICLIRLSRYLLTAGKEQKLIRMELSKVAEEVHLLREELKGTAEQRPSANSN